MGQCDLHFILRPKVDNWSLKETSGSSIVICDSSRPIATFDRSRPIATFDSSSLIAIFDDKSTIASFHSQIRKFNSWVTFASWSPR